MAAHPQRIRGILRALQVVWSIAGLTVLVIVLLELTLRLAFTVKDRMSSPERPDRRVIEEGYGGESWPVLHYRELDLLSDRWHPYIYFRQQPFQGQTIVIEADGTRRTWVSPRRSSESAGPAPFRIFTLGGSSLWGFGARDNWTIPSLVARRLDEHGYPVEMRNLAEIGHVSTQEVVALVRELQAGHRPDLVIFYDGVNDTTSAVLEGEAGVTTNEQNRRLEFNIRQSPGRLGAALLAGLIRDSATYRLAEVFGRPFARARMAQGLTGSGGRSELAAEVVLRYRANLAIVDRLARGFGFEVLYYWQPVVFDKGSLRPSEREEIERFSWGRDFVLEVYDRIRSSNELKSEPRFHDLSRLFDREPGLVFIDFCHTTEAANDRISEVIVHDSIEVLHSLARGRRGSDLKPGEVR